MNLEVEMRSRPVLFWLGSLTICLIAAGCGGNNNSFVPTPTPASTPIPPTISSVSPSVIASGSPDTAITVTGSAFVPTSNVLVNGTTIGTSFVSASQLSASIPSSLLAKAATLQISVVNASPGAGTSGSVSLSVVVVASLSLFATPAAAGSANGPWILDAVALNPSGTPVPGLHITFGTTAGALSPLDGFTTSNGVLGSIAPPAGIDPAQPVVITATTGNQTAAVNIEFQNPSTGLAARAAGRAAAREGAAAQGQPLNSLQPFSFGTAGSPSSSNPFTVPNTCYGDSALTSAPTATCQQVYAQNNLQAQLSNIVNQACDAFGSISDAASVLSCGGTAATIGTCLFGGELLCAGILEVPGAAEAAFSLFTDCAQLISTGLTEMFLGKTASQLVQQAFILADPADPANLLTEACTIVQDSFPPSPGNSGGRVYVADSSANVVRVYDSVGNTITVTGSFAGLSTPDGMAYDASNKHIYVANLGTNSVTVYDLDGNTVDLGTTAFAGLNDPEDIAFNPINRHFYVNEPSQNQVLVFDETGSPVTLGAGAFANLNSPFGLGWDSANGLIYVTNSGNNTMNVYDQLGNQVQTAIGAFAGLNSPDDVSWDPLTGNLYVTGVATDPLGACVVNQVFVYTPDGNTVVTSGFAGLNGPDAIVSNGNAVSPLYYVTNICGGNVSVFDRNGGPVALPLGAFGNLVQPTGVLVIP